MGIPHSSFEEKLENFKHKKGVDLDTNLTASDLKELVEQYKNVYLEATGEKFPSGTKLNTSNFFQFFPPLVFLLTVLYVNLCHVYLQIQNDSYCWLLKQFLILGTARGPTNTGASIR